MRSIQIVTHAMQIGLLHVNNASLLYNNNYDKRLSYRRDIERRRSLPSSRTDRQMALSNSAKNCKVILAVN